MLRAIALVSALWFCACVSPTDPFQRQEALKDAQKKYTDLVRWGQAEQAGRFVDPAQRDEFLREARQLSAFRITDCEVGEILRGKDTSHVTVTYRGYPLNTLVERTAHEDQEWYLEDGLTNTWLVRPDLGAVMAQIAGAPSVPARAEPWR